MSYTGNFVSSDGERVVISDSRGEWRGYAGRGVETAHIAPGATVEFEVEKVPPKDPTKKPYNRFTKIVAVGRGAPPSMQPIGAAAPRPSPLQIGTPNSVPTATEVRHENKDEQIYICGVTNQYVANTGDTAVKSLVEVGLRAREAFLVVFRGKQLAAQPVARSADPGHDDAPF